MATKQASIKDKYSKAKPASAVVKVRPLKKLKDMVG